MENFNFTTKVQINKSDIEIDFNSNILMLGSCFATEIGAYLTAYKFNVLVNPFGVLYNPCSIENSIKRLITCTPFVEEEVIQINPADLSLKKYASFSHHSSFSQPSVSSFLIEANKCLKISAEALKQADTIIITLGTSWVYKYIKTQKIVSNCHKIHPQNFSRELLSLEECYSIIKSIVNLLPDKNIIFTISPIRHFKDGANGNQISKATLLLAVNKVVEETKNNKSLQIVDYFPSYEIMIDELRDYRFYADDLLHPSPLAVKYIFSRFKETYVSSKIYTQMNINLKETKFNKHICRDDTKQ